MVLIRIYRGDSYKHTTMQAEDLDHSLSLSLIPYMFCVFISRFVLFFFFFLSNHSHEEKNPRETVCP